MTKHHTPEEIVLMAEKLKYCLCTDNPRRFIDEGYAMLRDIADADEKDRKDAERYRWLRNDPPLELAVRRKNPNPLHGDCAFTYLDADILDQAIDAARKASP